MSRRMMWEACNSHSRDWLTNDPGLGDALACAERCRAARCGSPITRTPELRRPTTRALAMLRPGPCDVGPRDDPRLTIRSCPGPVCARKPPDAATCAVKSHENRPGDGGS